MKLGLVVEGGGMKCAYTAGILDKFLDDQIRFDYAIGVSAGSSCTASFLAGQRDRNRRFFVEHVNDPGYMGFRTFLRSGSFFGLQYIYGDLTNSGGKDPLDLTALRQNETAFKIVATDAITGKAVYFDKSEIIRDDYRHFMASCAIPIVSKPIVIGNRKFYDGGCADPIPVRRAQSDGCEKMLVILCRPKDTVRTPEEHPNLIKAALHRYPNTIRAILDRYKLYNETLSYIKKLEAEGTALIMAPKEALPVSTYTRDPAVLQNLYDIAVREYEEEKSSILAFLER